MSGTDGIVLALSGGIGGAKLALGLSRVLTANRLVVVANTGDDFEHLGLHISPDIDTLMYTLAGISNMETGWGRADESWHFMEALAELGGETWFQLGDKDLAIHVERTRRLRVGKTLTQVTAELAARLSVVHRILPMSDDPVRTRIRTPDGWLAFQDYFVRQRCTPSVMELAFEGAATARPHPDILQLLSGDSLRAVVICPSNPFISIDPILAVPGIREAIVRCTAPVVAVSPIIAGKAVKGPTAKMMAELGLPVSAASVARHLTDLIDIYIADQDDAGSLDGVECPVLFARTLMLSLNDRIALAHTVLNAADDSTGARSLIQ